MRYFTGTTKENFESILETGFISIKPPHRVWKEFSQDYVYFMPFDETDEDAQIEAFETAAEQASFAIHTLNHTVRVVLEVEGLDDSLLDDDPDGAYGAVRYAKNIPIANIVAVHTEIDGDVERIKELIFITKFTQMKNQEKLPPLDFEYLLFEDEEMNQDIEEYRVHISEQIGIPHMDLVAPHLFVDDDEMSYRYDELLEKVEREATFDRKDIQEHLLIEHIA